MHEQSITETAEHHNLDIETRAKAICEQIIERFPGREVNLIGHSMGGLDARYLVTHLQPEAFTVKTLTTIATPHRGSAFADYLLVRLAHSEIEPLSDTLCFFPGGYPRKT